MQIHVRSTQLPRWFVPGFVLLALVLIPFALMLGLAFAALAVGGLVLRAFLPPADKRERYSRVFHSSDIDPKISDASAIDAEFEVKDSNEKE